MTSMISISQQIAFARRLVELGKINAFREEGGKKGVPQLTGNLMKCITCSVLRVNLCKEPGESYGNAPLTPASWSSRNTGPSWQQ